MMKLGQRASLTSARQARVLYKRLTSQLRECLSFETCLVGPIASIHQAGLTSARKTLVRSTSVKLARRVDFIV